MREIYMPQAIGRGALRELGAVPWHTLAHAYGRGVVADYGDVEGSLRRLGDPETFEEATYELGGNMYHQGTIYEVTADAVPFLVALARDPSLSDAQRKYVVLFLGWIAVSASYETEVGTHAGSFGEGVAERTRHALVMCEPHILTIAGDIPGLKPIAEAIAALATKEEPAEPDADELVELLETAEES